MIFGSSYDSSFGCFAKLCRMPFTIENVKGEQKVSITKLKSNYVIILRNCQHSNFSVLQNQRLASLLMINCDDCSVQFLDSAVVTSKTVRVINCVDCSIIIEDSDVRKIECFASTGTRFKLVKSPTIISNLFIFTRENCKNSQVQILYRLDTVKVMFNTTTIFSAPIPDSGSDTHILTYFDQLMKNFSIPLNLPEGKISPAADVLLKRLYPHILRVLPRDTIEESLPSTSHILDDLQQLESTKFKLTDEEFKKAFEIERQEYEEDESILIPKVKRIAQLIKESEHCVFYTGAGISTSADLPDFRGPQGVWTARENGVSISKKMKISQAHPTFSHYAITELCRQGLVKFVISTNMDCLHIRSGLPPHLICEQHGNVNKEICTRCGMEHWRAFDTGDTVINYRDHLTSRCCKWCGAQLRDSIVHFSENYSQEYIEPLSLHHSRKCDLAVILGTSMTVQPNATFPEECLKKEEPGKMVIVNLQKTPYDHIAEIRIFSKTDKFMVELMKELGIKEIPKCRDPKLDWDKENDSSSSDDVV